MGFERGFATQTLSQIPKVKALLSKAFTFGILKPTFRSYFPEKGIKIQNPYWEMILGNYHAKITIFLLLIRMH